MKSIDEYPSPVRSFRLLSSKNFWRSKHEGFKSGKWASAAQYIACSSGRIIGKYQTLINAESWTVMERMHILSTHVSVSCTNKAGVAIRIINAILYRLPTVYAQAAYEASCRIWVYFIWSHQEEWYAHHDSLAQGHDKHTCISILAFHTFRSSIDNSLLICLMATASSAYGDI